MLFLPVITLAQSDYEIVSARKVKMGYEAFPRDVRAEGLKWTGLDHSCLNTVAQGNWFDLKFKGDRMQFTVHTGGRFGDTSDPGIYLGKVVTDRGARSLEEVKCIQHQGDEGSFHLQATALDPEASYFLLVTAPKEGMSYAISTTTSFGLETQKVEEEDPIPSETATQEQASSQKINPAVQPEGQAMILGRLRDASGKVLVNTKVLLMNDDLQQVQEVTTDEYRGFRFEGVNPDKINLVKMTKDDSKWMIDMYMYDEDFEVIGKPIPLGHRLHSFKARDDYFRDLRILTENDVFVDVEQGGSYMTGKVVDKETYLVGREGVKVGLYNNTRSLVKTAITDLNGRFSFYDLENEEYIVKVEHNPDKDYVEIVISDSLHVPYKSANSNDMTEDGFFKFKALPMEIVELRRMEVMEDRGMLASAMEEELKVLIDEKNVGVAIELSTIEFNTGSSQLTLAKNRELDQLAEELISKPAIRIKIDGHTDNVGNEADNKRLSDERAAAVKSYLLGHGVASSRIITEGFGSSKPLASNDSEDGRSKNRRVEFTILN